MRLNGFYRRDEAVADSRDGLDKLGFAGGVSNSLAKFLHCRVQTVFEVDESILWPELGLQFLAGDDLARAGDQQEENFERLTVEFEAAAELVEGARRSIDCEIPETYQRLTAIFRHS